MASSNARLIASSQGISRRFVIGSGGAGIAAAAVGVTGNGGIARARGAQSTPVTAPEPSGVTPERLQGALAQLDSIVADHMERSGVPGIAVAVVHGDEVVYLAGYGEREVGTGEAVDADTVFQLASVSKPLAATTIAAVVGDGLTSWDARLVDLDPSFAMYDPCVTSAVTVRDMFSHRSGMVDHGGDLLEDLGYSREEVLHRLRYLAPEGRFRDHYAYTNFGLTAAAVGVATSIGETWEDLAAKRLYEPAGMTSTTSRFDEFMAMPNRASGHVLVDDAWVAEHQRQPDAQSPAGGVSSNVRDLAQWFRLLLGGGTLDGEELIATGALGEMWRPHSASNPAPDPAVDRTSFYGLGWNVSYDDDGRVRVSHSGAFALGAGTAVSVIPSEQLAIAVLGNFAAIGLVEGIAFTFTDLALTGEVNLDYWAVIEPFIAAANAPRYGVAIDYSQAPADTVPALDLDIYAGTYENDFYGDAVVALEGENLALQLGPNLTPFPMRHFNQNVFLFQPEGENAGGESAVTFTVEADSTASRMTIEYLDASEQGTFIRSSDS